MSPTSPPIAPPPRPTPETAEAATQLLPPRSGSPHQGIHHPRQFDSCTRSLRRRSDSDLAEVPSPHSSGCLMATSHRADSERRSQERPVSKCRPVQSPPLMGLRSIEQAVTTTNRSTSALSVTESPAWDKAGSDVSAPVASTGVFWKMFTGSGSTAGVQSSSLAAVRKFSRQLGCGPSCPHRVAALVPTGVVLR